MKRIFILNGVGIIELGIGENSELIAFDPAKMKNLFSGGSVNRNTCDQGNHISRIQSKHKIMYDESADIAEYDIDRDTTLTCDANVHQVYIHLIQKYAYA